MTDGTLAPPLILNEGNVSNEIVPDDIIIPTEFLYRYLPEFQWINPYYKNAKIYSIVLLNNPPSDTWWDAIGRNHYIYDIPAAHTPISLLDLSFFVRQVAEKKVPIEDCLNKAIFISVPSTPVKWRISTYGELLQAIETTHKEMKTYPYSLWTALKMLRRKIADPVIKGGSKNNNISGLQLMCKNRGKFVQMYHREPRLNELANFTREQLFNKRRHINATNEAGLIDGGAVDATSAVLAINLPIIVLVETVSVIVQVVLSHFLALAIGAKELPPLATNLKGGGIIYGTKHSVSFLSRDNFELKSNPCAVRIIGGLSGAPRDWLTNKAIDYILKQYCSSIAKFHFYPTNYCNQLSAFLQGINQHPQDRHYIVVNTAVSGNPGQHWIAIGYDQQVLLHYDSGASRLPSALLAALSPIKHYVTKFKTPAYSSQASRTECGIYCLLMAYYYAIREEDAILALTIPDSLCYKMRNEWYNKKWL